MYTMAQTHPWSTPHVMAGCWYIDFRKIIYPAKEEDIKMAYDQADSKGAALVFNNGEMQEEEVEMDLNLLIKKKRNKILTRDAKKAANRAKKESTRATARALREATIVAEKETKKAEKSGKSKAFTPLHLLIENSIASPSQNPHKRYSSFAQL
jgi:hypothetical protein